MNRTYIKNITKFLKTAYKDVKSGGCATWFHKLDDSLYVVVGPSDDDPKSSEFEVLAKIAYNVDDLQCDYELDWYMPTYSDGECAFTELGLTKGNFRKDAEWFYKEYKAMVKEIKKGNLFLK